MGKGSFSSGLLVILNIIYTILGLALTASSIWFFVEVYSVTSLRNANHYKLNYNVYWPQAIPWMFTSVGVFVLIVSFCGFAGVKRKSRSMVLIYVTFQVFALVLLILAAITSLVFADSEASDKFITDTVWDAFTNMKGESSIEKAFGDIERKLQCCGATSPRDYKNWRDDFPMSCCDTYYHGRQIETVFNCAITDKVPNERLGCSDVAAYYVRIAIKVLVGATIFTAVIGILNLATAIALATSLKKKPGVFGVEQNESESKKVPL